MHKTVIVAHNLEETAAYAVRLAEELRSGGVLFLFGDLGSGKTTFTQTVAKELGITKHIISPTFLIMRTYDLPEKKGKLYHVDLYRIGSQHEIEEIGVLDAMNDPGNIVIIEWSEKMGKQLPERRKELHFSFVDENTRSIEEINYD